MPPDVELFRDKDADTITIRVGREVATLPIDEWARLIARPQPANGFDFSRLAKDGGPA
jgi:hypothetical protein